MIRAMDTKVIYVCIHDRKVKMALPFNIGDPESCALHLLSDHLALDITALHPHTESL